ncbi:MAG: hypothetical protein QOE70_5992 [Chthoniobacter sp.]|jgi:hypothetical protein|nr:hypothetical protein [Chthoniobacter sp.]
MKTMRSLPIVLLIFLLATATAQARVVVYKGTAKVTESGIPTHTTGTFSRIFFLVINFDTLQGNMIFAQGSGQNKTIFDNGSRNYGIVEIPTVPTPTIYLTAVDPNNGTTDPHHFTHIYSHFHGKKAQLTLESGPGGFVGNLPKSLSAFVSTTIGNLVFAGAGTVSFDVKRTQQYNATGQTNNVNGASLAIRGEYFQLGYADKT